MLLSLTLFAYCFCLEIPSLIFYNSSFKTPQDSLLKGSLPTDFLYGFASAATQVEGAFDKDGKSLSIWDKFATERNAINNKSNPFVSNDEYHLTRETVALLKLSGARAYRFSIAWTRLVPEGR
jgi:beta-glucosidase/6-phospho-beta-glucosidase/beta-galactosidase